ncbi:MAG TPA: GNAT family protein [Chitinophagaceae bacterium]|nr:GNAT family protein [Chitinophagaceae bacterium]
MLTINLNPFPVLETNRLVLRQINKDDANEIFILRSDSRVMQHILRPIAKTLDDALQLIQIIADTETGGNGITWAITLKETNRLIGTIGYWQMKKEHYRAEIGYLLSPDFQRKGMMQEALSAVINYGFKEIKLHSIEANVAPENKASINLLERNKFVKEGYFKEDYFFEGKFFDTVIYSLLSTKW